MSICRLPVDLKPPRKSLKIFCHCHFLLNFRRLRQQGAWVAPTLLALMDLAIPTVMPGRVLGVTERLERLSRARQADEGPALRAA